MKKNIKKLLMILIILCILVLSWGTYQYISITSIGENAVPQKADVIIILGAAVWPHGPSPALQSRIVHGKNIYEEGLAEYFILTGGLGQNPPTEAKAMRQGLLSLGMKEEVLFLEEKATNTKENLVLSKMIMEENQWKTAIIVTDVFHLKRGLLMAKDQGIIAYGAPVKNSALYRNKLYKFRYTLREVLAITYYYIDSILN